METRLVNLTWPEIEEIVKKPHVVIVPTGSIEQHGPHLPLSVDYRCPEYVAELAADKVMKEHNIHALVAPPVQYGEVSLAIKGFPGCIGVSTDTAIKLFEDIARTFIYSGFKDIIFLNGHATNVASIVIDYLIVIAITGWAEYARTVRGTVLSIREKEYVEAAHALGFGPGTIMIKYLLINAVTPILVLTAVQVPRVIILEATLSFLGLGVPVTTPSIGMAIARGYEVLFSGRWWASIFPGLALMLLVGCINVLADWLRDALEPRSREQV